MVGHVGEICFALAINGVRCRPSHHHVSTRTQRPALLARACNPGPSTGNGPHCRARDAHGPHNPTGKVPGWRSPGPWWLGRRCPQAHGGPFPGRASPCPQHPRRGQHPARTQAQQFGFQFRAALGLLTGLPAHTVLHAGPVAKQHSMLSADIGDGQGAHGGVFMVRKAVGMMHDGESLMRAPVIV